MSICSAQGTLRIQQRNLFLRFLSFLLNNRKNQHLICLLWKLAIFTNCARNETSLLYKKLNFHLKILFCLVGKVCSLFVQDKPSQVRMILN